MAPTSCQNGRPAATRSTNETTLDPLSGGPRLYRDFIDFLASQIGTRYEQRFLERYSGLISFAANWEALRAIRELKTQPAGQECREWAFW